MSGFFIQSQISTSYNAMYMFIEIDFDAAIWNAKFLLMPSQSSGTWRQRYLFLLDSFWIIGSLNIVFGVTKEKYNTPF